MVGLPALAALGSAFTGLSHAAALGSAAEYDDGSVHSRIMAIKMAQWEEEMASGQMDSAQYPELGYTPCVDGFAEAIAGDVNNTFRCNNVRGLSCYSLDARIELTRN